MTIKASALFVLALLFCLATATVVAAASSVATAQQPPRRTPPARPPGQPALPLTPTRSLALPTALPAMTPAATLGAVTRVAEYAAADVLRTFAAQHLRLAINVGRATGASGTVAVPGDVQSEIDAAAELAGQVSVGAITAGSARGAAEVAVGSGTISGDLDADISSAALGAYSLLLATPPPRSSGEALSLIRSIYPALAGLDLAQQSGGSTGYVFRASTITEGVDPRTLTVTAIVQEVVAGVTGQGRSTVVWVVVGNGDFAAALATP